MADKIPFDEDMMTLIMGVGGPEEPGQHGRAKAPFPTKDAITIITDIRDMCEDFLEKVGKDDQRDEEGPTDEGKDESDGFPRHFEEREEKGQERQERR